jgi:hypothetical protein
MSKEALFKDDEKMKEDILANFHPYFEPLKEMMMRWWNVMMLAYRERKFEYYTIHDQIIPVIDKAIENLPNYQPNDESKTKAETKRRQDLREGRVKWFKGRSNNRTASDASSDQGAASALEFSPQRPIRVPVHEYPQLPAEPGSPYPNPKKQKLDDMSSFGDMVS